MGVRWVPVLTMIVALTATAAWAGTETARPGLASAINMAGRQRMLTQRIVLTYCQLGLGIQADKAHSRLREAIEVFDRQLLVLEQLAATADVVTALNQVDYTWHKFKQVAEGPPTREGARMLLYLNDDLLYQTDKVVQLLQDMSDAPYARLVNIAGRQRMLSQRAIKFYMLQEWGFDTLTIRDELERTRIEFVGALATLRAAPENTPDIARELDEVELQWMWFDHALTLKGEDTYPLIVAESGEAILERMDRVTSMYERLFK